jgi:hypothetical protein
MAEEAELSVIEELLPGAAEEVGLTSAAAPAVAESAPVYDYGPPPTEGNLPPATADVVPTPSPTDATSIARSLTNPTAATVASTPVAEPIYGSELGVPVTPQSISTEQLLQQPSNIPTSPYDVEDLAAGQGATAASEASKKLAEQAAKSGFDPTKALEYLGLTKTGGGLGPNALPAAALGLSQYRANKQAQKLEDQLKAASAQTKGVATSLIDKYQTGTIDPAQQKQIDDLTNNTKARIKQRYAQMGRDPNTDSAAQSELAKADADSIAMQDAAKQGILTQGLRAAGLAQGPATSAVMAGYQSDLAQQQAMQSFLNTLAIMQSRQPATP